MANATKINLETFAQGAMAEKLNIELQKVMENIHDPNTDPTKARKVTLTLTLKADENRDFINVDINSKSILAPSKGVNTKMILGMDGQGKVVSRELASGAPGQTYFGDDGIIRNDEGKPVDEEEKKVSDLNEFKTVKFQ